MVSKSDLILSCFVLLIKVTSVIDALDTQTSSNLHFNLFHKLHFLDPPKSTLNKVDEQWFEQRLDHFNAQVVGTWSQRYFSR